MHPGMLALPPFGARWLLALAGVEGVAENRTDLGCLSWHLLARQGCSMAAPRTRRALDPLPSREVPCRLSRRLPIGSRA